MKKWVILLGVGVLGGLVLGMTRMAGTKLPPMVHVASLYKEELEFKPAEPVFVAELNYLLETLKIAREKGWMAEAGSRLPVRLDDYDPELMEKYVDREIIREIGIVVPQRLNSIYITDAAQEEITSLIIKIRQEFLDYAENKGVANKYLQEIETVTLPNSLSRIHYYPTSHYPADARTRVATFQGAAKGDYRQLQMDIYGSNVYKICQEIEAAGILGKKPEAGEEIHASQCRDMALRYVVFHEMIHVLQQAVNVVNAPDNMKHSLLPWLYSNRSILEIDATYYKTWGRADSLSRAMNNMEIAKESQAEGVAAEMVGDVYTLSPVQRQLWWEHHFGSLRQGTRDVNELFRLAAEWYPGYSPGQLAHDLRQEIIEHMPGTMESEPKRTLLKMQERLDGYMATHVGYLNPMQPGNTGKFWNYLKE